MPPIDDELERRFRGIDRPIDTDGVVAAIERRRRRRVAVSRAGTVGLAVVVLAGTLFGYRVLDRAFGEAVPADGGGGVIAFRRYLRACTDLPHVSGGLDIFAVTPDGSTQWRMNPDAMHNGRRYMFESQPSFSPDGERYAWVDHYADGLWVTEVRTNRTTKLADGGASTPRWLPDGSAIVYTNTPDPGATGLVPGGIFAIDPEGGEPRLLAEKAGLPVVSPDGGTIAFLRQEFLGSEGEPLGSEGEPLGSEGDVRTSLWFMDADGGNEREVRVQPQDARFSLHDADWAPDGTRFVVEASVDGNVDLYVVNIDGETGYRLTDDPADDTSPSWSPDGQMIAFETGRWGTGVGHAEIAVVSAGGGEPTRLTKDCWDDVEPEWVENDAAIRSLPTWTVPPLPDLGTRGAARPGDILFGADVDGVGDIYAIGPNGGDAVNLTADVPAQGSPRWSPDDEWIAFSLYGDPDRTDGVYVMRPDGTDVRLIAEGAARPSWSPDGSRIAVETDHGIDLIDAATGDRTTLTRADDHHNAWAPDGRSVVVSRWGGSRGPGLYVVDVTTGDAVRLTAGQGDQAPDWSPDGSMIAFQRANDIAVVPASGGSVTTLLRSTTAVAYRSPVWSPDGSMILFVSSQRPALDEERGGLWLWTMTAGGSDVRPVKGSPASVAPEPDW